MTDLHLDHPFNDASPDIEKRAREISTVRGHKDPDEIIVCSDGATNGIRVPVWKFYIAEAECDAWIDELDILFPDSPSVSRPTQNSEAK